MVECRIDSSDLSFDMFEQMREKMHSTLQSLLYLFNQAENDETTESSS